MIRVLLDGPALMLEDNMSVVINTTLQSPMLRKKHWAIGYYCAGDYAATGTLQFAHITPMDNIADIMTKPLPNQQFHTLAKGILLGNLCMSGPRHWAHKMKKPFDWFFGFGF